LISRNRILANGGANLAGGIGIFDGSARYQIADNDLCGNFSAEYGGAISHYGSSDGGSITGNRIWLNQSYDEAGGILVAGELPTGNQTMSSGAADGRASVTTSGLTISGNEIVANLANDDGGGIRLLSAGKVQINILNNIVADNVSTHEGGGLALDDAASVSLVGNTVARNVTTATAITSNGLPAPAGLSTASNSVQLQAELSATAPKYSRPVLKDNLFFDNRAGTFDSAAANGVYVTGIGAVGDSGAPAVWDIGSLDVADVQASPMAPTTSIFNTSAPAGYGSEVTGTSADTAKPTVETDFVNPYVIGVSVLNNRATLNTNQSLMIVQNAALDSFLDYHLDSGATAINKGAADPLIPVDIDRDVRPQGSGVDIGADEFVTP
jgi:hypothetical protein